MSFIANYFELVAEIFMKLLESIGSSLWLLITGVVALVDMIVNHFLVFLIIIFPLLMVLVGLIECKKYLCKRYLANKLLK